MQLFAIIAKQDDGLTDAKISYVDLFLKQQLDKTQVEEYMNLFMEFAKEKKKRRGGDDGEEKEGKALTSMTDSVRTLGICKKINKTLAQKQKIIVIVRLLELVNSDRNFSEQRLAIIDTASQVFKITPEEYKSIESFVKGNVKEDFDDSNLLVIADSEENVSETCKFLKSDQLDKVLVILRIQSVNLYFLRYTGKNEIVLNGLIIDNSRIHLFAGGSTIKPPFGKTIYYSDVSSIFLSHGNNTKLSFNANHITYQFKNGNLGLRDVNISEESGKLIGIMGASGAGKTTLLNVLAGLESPTKGEVLINGVDLHKETQKLEGVIGYVPQDDLLIEELTVYENLFYNAKLCFKDLSDQDIDELVMGTLENLGLAQAKDLKVGNPLQKTISGGQRKRLNIALELIREPSVLFLDEPTSGLSSKDSENILDLLRQIALKGKLIFVVIHQPSSEIYKSFDKIVFLDTGGYLIYNGNPVEAITYFKTADNQINSKQGECPTCGNVNSELIFNIVESKIVDEYGNLTPNRKVKPETWAEYYEEQFNIDKLPDEKNPPKKTLHIPSKLKQFAVFLKRDYKSKISNKQYILINLIQTPILAFFLSFIIRYTADPENGSYIFRENENIPAYILMCIVVSLFVGLTVSAEEIFKDRKILKRESFLNLSKISYLFSKITILFALSALQSVFLVLIGNSILGIHGMYLEYWLMLFSISCFANVLGLNISNTFNSAVTIYIIIPLLIIPQMVLAGAMFSFDKLNSAIGGGHEVPVIAQFMPSRWAYEGLVVNQFMENDYQKNWYGYEKRESMLYYKSAYYLPELKDVLKDSKALLDSGKVESPEYQKNLTLLANELTSEQEILGQAIPFIDQLTPTDFNEETFKTAQKYLDGISDIYNLKYNTIVQQKEIKLYEITSKDTNNLLQLLKDNYDNDYLNEVVKNVLSDNKIARHNNELIQVMDPIYMDNEPSLMSLNAPFYSPEKYVLNKKMSTYSFNILIIWIMTIVAFIALYFNWLIKAINIFENSPLKRKKE